MGERELSVSHIVSALVVPMGLMALGVSVFAMVNQPNATNAEQRISEKAETSLNGELSKYLANIEGQVADAVIPGVANAALESATSVQGAIEARLNVQGQQTDTLEAKYDALRDLMKGKGLQLRSIEDYVVEQPTAAYPELTYDKSQEAYFYEFGDYLAGECTSCHKVSYDFTGIPLIFGMNESYFVGRLQDYKSGKLTNEAMASVARGLDDEMMLSLALFFKAQEPKEG